MQENRAGPRWLEFPGLGRQKGIWHGIFTRCGGNSLPPFDGLNTALSVGDRKADVEKNRSLILKTTRGRQLRFVRQVHRDKAVILDDGGSSENPISEPTEADAMITQVPGQDLAIQVADCQAVMLYDPVRRVVANIHSGWRGSIGNIIGKTIQKMTEGFGSDPSDLLGGIGPSLGPCCAEFINYRTEIPEQYWLYRDENDHFDFWAIGRDQLTEAGLKSENIEKSGICTRCRTDLFFSYRGEGITGRFSAVIGLR